MYFMSGGIAGLLKQQMVVLPISCDTLLCMDLSGTRSSFLGFYILAYAVNLQLFLGLDIPFGSLCILPIDSRFIFGFGPPGHSCSGLEGLFTPEFRDKDRG